jgi:hypothetical protein
MKTEGHRIKRQRKGMRKNMKNRLRNERNEKEKAQGSEIQRSGME